MRGTSDAIDRRRDARDDEIKWSRCAFDVKSTCNMSPSVVFYFTGSNSTA